LPTSWQFIGNGTTVYSDQPLPEYNTKFWTNNNLSTVYTPPVANQYYLIKLNGTLPSILDKKYYTYNLTGNEIWGAAILLSNGEIQRTSTGVHVETRLFLSNGNLTSTVPFPRQTNSGNEYYSWP
jgi:hypothetical protein